MLAFIHIQISFTMPAGLCRCINYAIYRTTHRRLIACMYEWCVRNSSSRKCIKQTNSAPQIKTVCVLWVCHTPLVAGGTIEHVHRVFHTIQTLLVAHRRKDSVSFAFVWVWMVCAAPIHVHVERRWGARNVQRHHSCQNLLCVHVVRTYVVAMYVFECFYSVYCCCCWFNIEHKMLRLGSLCDVLWCVIYWHTVRHKTAVNAS